MTDKVENMRSSNGNKVANQFEILKENGGSIFQSYNSTIVEIKTGDDGLYQTYLDEKYWNYSHTTSKYRNIFLNENTKDTKAKIESGEYILTNLNK